jgi:hypothetical protein
MTFAEVRAGRLPLPSARVRAAKITAGGVFAQGIGVHTGFALP